jgi:hypothetical protein
LTLPLHLVTGLPLVHEPMGEDERMSTSGSHVQWILLAVLTIGRTRHRIDENQMGAVKETDLLVHPKVKAVRLEPMLFETKVD